MRQKSNTKKTKTKSDQDNRAQGETKSDAKEQTSPAQTSPDRPIGQMSGTKFRPDQDNRDHQEKWQLLFIKDYR